MKFMHTPILDFQLNPSLSSFPANTLHIVPMMQTETSDDLSAVTVDGTWSSLPYQDWLDANGFNAKAGQVLMAQGQGDWVADRVCFWGLGQASSLTLKTFRHHWQKLVAELLNAHNRHLHLHWQQLALSDGDAEQCLVQTVQLLQEGTYQFAHDCRGDFKPKVIATETVAISAQSFDLADGESMVRLAQATANGMALTKELANMPANVCTPGYLVEIAETLAQDSRVSLDVLDLDAIRAKGMGAFYSVAKGSTEPAYLIALHYQHPDAQNDQPVALVGKGVTFDTGGISLKPGAKMDEMKYDMGGAATALGTLQAVVEADLPLNVVVMVPATENMPAGNASKPGDVVTSLSGQTIEVLNTDAEGRLILCDALTYVQQQYNAKVIVDMATLTGACIVALGNHVSGLMGNDDDLLLSLQTAGLHTYDRLWPLPLYDEYDEQLKSGFADMANIGTPGAGTITAGCFLSRFTKDVKWAHLDIAGTAWVSGGKKAATGRPVPTLVRWLTQYAM